MMTMMSMNKNGTRVSWAFVSSDFIIPSNQFKFIRVKFQLDYRIKWNCYRWLRIFLSAVVLYFMSIIISSIHKMYARSIRLN